MVRVVLTYGPTSPRLRADLSRSELSAGRVVWHPTNYTKVRAMHRLYTTLHKTILGFADVVSMEKFC
jgi:hypothetical protein